MTYQTEGVCSARIDFELADGVIHNAAFTGGCDGNLKAISKLIEGRRADEIAALFKGHRCGRKPTSCADQLSRALEAALARAGA